LSDDAKDQAAQDAPSSGSGSGSAAGSGAHLVPLAPTDLYLNKELSWLEFNARVLDEALNPETPLLERLKFLSIFTSNLDEFFMVRVAGLKKMEQESLRITDSPDRMDTVAVLQQIRVRTTELIAAQYHCLHEQVLPALAAEDVKIVGMDELTPTQRATLDDYFEAEVSPVLTPLGVDPAHPFPFLSNLSLYLVVVPKDHRGAADGEIPSIGFVEVPPIVPRLIPVQMDPGAPSDAVRFVLLEDLIANNLQELFIGYSVEATYTVRVTRNLDYNLLESKVVDLLKSIQKEMVNREHQEVVRIEIDSRLPEPLVTLLKTKLQVADADVYRVPRPLHLSGLMALYGLPLDRLKDPPFNPRLPQALAGSEDIFSVIAKKDLLVHHPYESFYAVIEFIAHAAYDPSVLAIKQTLYRSAGDSPIIDSLIAAAENGKQVTAVVELKARFDEKNNITWARRLERAGVNVVFGFVGLKTHCKMTLVVRREKSRLVRYVHLSTGNYNSATAKLYTDCALFTANDALGSDVATIFNLITGFDVLTGQNRIPDAAILERIDQMALAPVDLRQEIVSLIEGEIESAKRTGSGFIMAKMNALVDKDIIDALYRASRAGVRIQLIVRGTCSLRPGIPGVSDNIEVISIIDRFLEHSRIYYFQAGGEHRVYLASADWMPRNMDRRIEIMIPIEDRDVKARLTNEILRTCWADNMKARALTSDGRWVRRRPQPGQAPVRSQARFIELVREGGIQSMPYEIAIRHQKQGQRPIAKAKRKKGGGEGGGGQGGGQGDQSK
jgi:polyphosphate kinase